jgi:ketosteroid isomerase-like protein
VSAEVVDVYRSFSQIQRRFYAGEAEMSELEQQLTEDVEWHVPGHSPIAGWYRGRDEVLRYFERRRDLASRSFRISVKRVVADDEYVFTLADGHAELTGKARQWQTVGIYRVRDGAVAEGWLLPFDQVAFDEIWAA